MANKPKKDLTKGSVRKHIVFLAIPMLVAMFMHNLYNLVDTFFVGRIGPEAIAAVAAAFPVFFVIISMITGLGVGVNSFVARSIGAKDFEKVNAIAENGLLIAATLSVVVTAAGFFTIKPLISFLGVTPTVASFMKDYISIIYLGSVAFFFGNVANALLQGEGDTKTPMKGLLLANVTNIILDPVLIFGLGPLPAMGVKGAAIATIIAQSIGAAYSYKHLFSGKSLIRLKFKRLTYSLEIMKGIFSVGIPTTVSQGAITVGMFFVNKLIATFGSAALAGFGIAFRMESIAILPGLAIGLATLSVMGQNIGAKQYARARRASMFSSISTFLFMESVGVLFFLTATTWVSIFTSNQDVINHGKDYFSIVALTYGFLGLRFIAANSFQSLGKAWQVLAITVMTFAIMIPLAYFLGTRNGISGVWWGVAFAIVIAGIASQTWFQNTLKHAEKLHLEKNPLVVSD